MIDFPAANSTSVSGISNRDEIVGGWVDSGNVHHGFILIEGRSRTIDLPGATFTNAQGVNDWGEIVGRADVGGAVHGYVFGDGHFVLIDFPGASNARSEIVGQYIYRQQRPHPRPERGQGRVRQTRIL